MEMQALLHRSLVGLALRLLTLPLLEAIPKAISPPSRSRLSVRTTSPVRSITSGVIRPNFRLLRGLDLGKASAGSRNASSSDEDDMFPNSKSLGSYKRVEPSSRSRSKRPGARWRPRSLLKNDNGPLDVDLVVGDGVPKRAVRTRPPITTAHVECRNYQD